MGLLIGITYVDAYGRTTTRRVGTTSTVLADAVDDAVALKTAMAAVSDLGTVKYDISAGYPSVVAAEDESNVDVGATLTVLLESGKRAPFRIPGISAAKLDASGNVNLADEDIVALLALFITTANLRISDGEAITEALHGELDK